MGIHILQGWYGDTAIRHAVMYSSSTDWAFGPVFTDSEDGLHEAAERIQLFLEWLPFDARQYDDNELESKYHEFLSKESELWAAKDKEVIDNE